MSYFGPDATAKLGMVLGDQRLPTRPFTGPQAATVLAVSGDTLTFTLKGVPGYEHVAFGPAPYPRPAIVAQTGATVNDPNTPAVPPVGTECRVDFVGFDLTSPFVVMFVAWP